MRESYQVTNFEGLDNLVCSRIKSKSQLIAILITCMKMVLTDFSPNNQEGVGTFSIKDYKSKRRIFFTINDNEKKAKKYFSFILPFNINEAEDELSFIGKNTYTPVGLYTLEILSTLCKNDWFGDNNEDNYDIELFSESHIELIREFNITLEEKTDLWTIIKLLLTFEPGYIRYDYDPDNAIDDVHPLHHLDIYYSDEGTFKLGFHESIKVSERLEFSSFEDILLDGLSRLNYCYKVI